MRGSGTRPEAVALAGLCPGIGGGGRARVRWRILVLAWSLVLLTTHRQFGVPEEKAEAGRKAVDAASVEGGTLVFAGTGHCPATAHDSG